MERIQSALAKARAERSGKTPSSDQDAVVHPPAAPKAAPRVRRSGPEADQWAALPEFQIDAKRMKRNRIVAMQSGREGTGIDMMRTRVLQQMRDNGWRRLAITSPTVGCGKSTIALNLAMSLQRQPDLRTVLMELDLRRPSLGKMLGIERDISFAHVLEGTQEFADNAVRYGANLAISCNQRPWRDAAELLSSDHVADALSAIEQTYAPDLMIFDTPPMLVTDDMMAFARHVDCVLLVAGAEATTVKEIDVCETDLASQTNVMGVVLNKCRYMGPEYGDDYYE